MVTGFQSFPGSFSNWLVRNSLEADGAPGQGGSSMNVVLSSGTEIPEAEQLATRFFVEDAHEMYDRILDRDLRAPSRIGARRRARS